MNFTWNRCYKNKFLMYCLFLIYSIIFINNVIKINIYKYQQIINYDIKKKFYKMIQLEYGFLKYVNLVDFPQSYKGSIFFAHEQSEILKFMFDQNSPYIIINDDTGIAQVSIKFLKVKHNKIEFELIK